MLQYIVCGFFVTEIYRLSQLPDAGIYHVAPVNQKSRTEQKSATSQSTNTAVSA
jgi:hypothetical protein